MLKQLVYIVKRNARWDNKIRIRLSEKPGFQTVTENRQ